MVLFRLYRFDAAISGDFAIASAYGENYNSQDNAGSAYIFTGMYPSQAPTNAPSDAPTIAPTAIPTVAPSNAPFDSPTSAPTRIPTDSPTNAPIWEPTDAPTMIPTNAPSNSPTGKPSNSPGNYPTNAPYSSPSDAPSIPPTASPTQNPTQTPSLAPNKGTKTSAPTNFPTNTPVDVLLTYATTEGNDVLPSTTLTKSIMTTIKGPVSTRIENTAFETTATAQVTGKGTDVTEDVSSSLHPSRPVQGVCVHVSLFCFYCCICARIFVYACILYTVHI